MALCRDGTAVPYDVAALDAAAAGLEVEYEVVLDSARPTGAEAEVFFSDFGHGYVTINAEYTT